MAQVLCYVGNEDMGNRVNGSRSLAVWTAAVPEDDLITAKALTAHSADQRQITNLQFAAGFVSRPPFPPTTQWL